MPFKHTIVCTRCKSEQLASRDMSTLPSGWRSLPTEKHTCQTCTQLYDELMTQHRIELRAFWANKWLEGRLK